MLEFPNQCLKPMEMKQRIPFYPLLNGRSFPMMIWSKAPLFPIHWFRQPLANCSTVHIESQLDRSSPLHTTHLQFPYFQHFTFHTDQDAQIRSTRCIEFWIRLWFTSWSATSSKLWMIQPNFLQRVFTRSAGQHVNSYCQCHKIAATYGQIVHGISDHGIASNTLSSQKPLMVTHMRAQGKQ
jgi:hypothetical protein